MTPDINPTALNCNEIVDIRVSTQVSSLNIIKVDNGHVGIETNGEEESTRRSIRSHTSNESRATTSSASSAAELIRSCDRGRSDSGVTEVRITTAEGNEGNEGNAGSGNTSPTYRQRIVNALRTHCSLDAEIELTVGSRVSFGLNVLPSLPSIPPLRDISLPPVVTALPPLTATGSVASTIISPITTPISSTLTSLATSLSTTGSTLTSLATSLSSTAATNLSSSTVAGSSSTLTSVASTLTSAVTGSVEPSIPATSSVSFATWAANGLHVEVEKKSAPSRCMLGVGRVALHSEIGVSNGSGHVSGSEAVRTGIMQQKEQEGTKVSAFSEFEVSGRGGSGFLPLHNPFSPSEGAFADLPVGFGGSVGARARVKTTWSLNHNSAAGKMKSAVVNGVLLGSHLVGAGVGGAIGAPFGWRDHGMASGANLLVGAATAALSVTGPFMPNTREYTVEAEAVPVQSTLRFSLPTPAPIAVESYVGVTARPRVALCFKRVIEVEGGNNVRDVELGEIPSNTDGGITNDGFETDSNSRQSIDSGGNQLEWDESYSTDLRGQVDSCCNVNETQV